MTLKQAQEEGAESMQLVELLINHCEDVRIFFISSPAKAAELKISPLLFFFPFAALFFPI